MYVAVDGYPCVRILNLSGEIGCSSKLLFLGLHPLTVIVICRYVPLILHVYKSLDPGLNKVVAPIIKLKDFRDLVKPHTILVTADEMEDFFTRHVPFLSFFAKLV